MRGRLWRRPVPVAGLRHCSIGWAAGLALARALCARSLWGYVLLTSCAPHAVGLRLEANGERRLEALPALCARLPLGLAPAPLASVVAAHTTGLVGSLLGPNQEHSSWQLEAAVSEAPLLARRLVVFGEGSQLLGLDAATGAPIWSIERQGAHLEAATDDGELTALVLSTGRRDQRWLRVVDRRGRERLRLQAAAELGAPALVAGTLLLPWGQRFLSAIDVGSGSELGRAGLAPSLRHALWVGDGLFLAGPPWLALTQAPGKTHALPVRPLPGRVEVGSASLAPGSDPDVTRLFVRPPQEPGDALPPYLATYGRLAMSFDGGRGSLQWVRLMPGPILAAAAGPNSFALCDATGVVRVLGADGARSLSLQRLGPAQRNEPVLRSCALEASQSWPIAEERATADGAPAARDEEALVDQLAGVLALSDPDLADAQRFLSRELAVRTEPEATRVLIALASRRSADPILQAEAEDLLATRRNGAEFMLQALESSGPRSADPIARAPLGALADALEALDERRAAPLLAAQMNQLGHSPQALARVARALEHLASEAEYAPLEMF
ncbi:MAG: hypothetical protein ABI895_33050, partial [Deltaproteobacteria bacterium]